ncbi:unnamed protein product [Arctia plantaginis]|uniref:Peptidase S1 domain-containing protein n=1 Tax=Arctia plantaginis TaxID=874455 RepID=A0A8S0YY41_ARCPL|nr:unnamed protein product [Arctia plantaginis]
MDISQKENGNVSEELQHFRVFSINRDICRSRYRDSIVITDNTLCSGWLDVGSRDQCTRDSVVATACLRIIGGTVTTIEKYPPTAAVLLIGYFSTNQICGGSIINQRHILTAAHCFTFTLNAGVYLIRVGSSMAHSGGTTHHIDRIILHPQWNTRTVDNDVAIMRTTTAITYGITVQPANLAESTYRLLDNDSVWAVGWGLTSVSTT